MCMLARTSGLATPAHHGVHPHTQTNTHTKTITLSHTNTHTHLHTHTHALTQRHENHGQKGTAVNRYGYIYTCI